LSIPPEPRPWWEWRGVLLRMDRPVMSPLAILIAVGVIAVGVVGAIYLVVRAQHGVMVWVPRRELPAFHQLSLEDLVARQLPSGSVAPSAIREKRALIGRYTLTRAGLGQPLPEDRLGPALSSGVLDRSIIVGIGMSSSSFANRLERGSTVDLLLPSRRNRLPADPVLLRNIVVLDVLSAEGGVGSVVAAVPRGQRQALLEVAITTPMVILSTIG
jgi:hypothetical protein